MIWHIINKTSRIQNLCITAASPSLPRTLTWGSIKYFSNYELRLPVASLLVAGSVQITHKQLFMPTISLFRLVLPHSSLSPLKEGHLKFSCRAVRSLSRPPSRPLCTGLEWVKRVQTYSHSWGHCSHSHFSNRGSLLIWPVKCGKKSIYKFTA